MSLKKDITGNHLIEVLVAVLKERCQDSDELCRLAEELLEVKTDYNTEEDVVTVTFKNEDYKYWGPLHLRHYFITKDES